jgi:hypothetical protein
MEYQLNIGSSLYVKIYLNEIPKEVPDQFEYMVFIISFNNGSIVGSSSSEMDYFPTFSNNLKSQ